MATFRFEISGRPSRNRTYVLFLCVTVGGKRTKIKTSVELRSKNDFNPKAKQGNWIRPSESHAKVWNEALAQTLERAKQEYREQSVEGVATSENIILGIKAGEKSSSFLSYTKQHIDELFTTGNIRTHNKYKCFLNKVSAFLTKNGKQDLTFAEITPAWVAKFNAHLSGNINERYPDKKLHPNTIKKSQRA
jgi:hypothetical protein